MIQRMRGSLLLATLIFAFVLMIVTSALLITLKQIF